MSLTSSVLASSTSISGKGSASKMSLADLEKFEKMMKNLEKQGEKGSQGPSAVISAREGAPGPSRVEEVRKIAQENGTNATNSGYDEIPVHEIRIDDESVGKKGPDARQTVHDQPLSPAETPLSPTPKSSLRKISQELPEAAAVTPRALQPMEEDFVLTVDEPPDEADLRRQMIDYNLHDIGSVVAELTLEEEGEDGYDDDEYDYGEDSDDSDQYGRSTRPMITPEIHREMQALQARIQARMELEKKDKPQTQPEDDETKPEQRALEIKISQDESHNSQATASPKKGVRFSNVLDVSPAPPPLPPSQQPTAPVSQQQGYILPPLPNPDPEDAVPFLVELLAREQMLEDLKSQGLNTKGNGPAENEQDQVGGERAVQKEKKVSRFKAMRSGTVEESDIPIQENEKAKEVNSQALKTSIIERAPGPATAPSIPVAPPAMSANDKPKKISRFKAAKSVESLPVGIKQLTTEPSAGIYENSFAYRKFLDDNQEDDSANQEKKARPLVASTVIERPPTVISTSSPSVIPAAPDELDPAIHRQEVAVDFFKSRNKLIQKEGGFLSRDEDQMYVPIEDENVGKKKVSRFKAARVGGQR